MMLKAVIFFCLILSFECGSIGRPIRHYFGDNGTLPKTMVNLGTVNIKG